MVGLNCPACTSAATGRFRAGDWHCCRECGAWSMYTAVPETNTFTLAQKTDPVDRPVDRRKQVRKLEANGSQ